MTLAETRDRRHMPIAKFSEWTELTGFDDLIIFLLEKSRLKFYRSRSETVGTRKLRECTVFPAYSVSVAVFFFTIFVLGGEQQ